MQRATILLQQHIVIHTKVTNVCTAPYRHYVPDFERAARWRLVTASLEAPLAASLDSRATIFTFIESRVSALSDCGGPTRQIAL